MAEPEAETTLDDERSASIASAPIPQVASGFESRASNTLPEAGTVPPPALPQGPDLPTVPRAVYEAGEEIARGGIGRIYRAKDLRLDRIVAIKELLEPTATNQRRFLREIEVTVGLEHPNIVTIHEAGRWPDGQPFYSMNFVRGRTLLTAIEECASLEERLLLLPATISVADAVAYAHDKGVIHRDLKPANVLVGRFGETVVIDWGLAKYTGAREAPAPHAPLAAPGQTRHGAVVGTPPYMPPEQARGEAVDASADVYALGVMLYQLLSGRTPFDDVPPERLIAAIQRDTPRPLSALAPELAPDLLAIVDKAMARSPFARYRTAREMVEELRHFAAGRLVGAYSYGITDLFQRFVRKHKGSVITAAIAFVVLLASASYSVNTVRGERDMAQRHAHAAEEARDRAEARSRALIVAQALALTESDPTEAVARLKQLPSATQGAISVAARAEEFGVAEAVLSGTSSQLACATFAPDGRSLVAAGENHELLLWSLHEPGASKPFGQEEPRRFTGHTERISSCEYSPNGRHIASTGYDGQVIVWDVNDATQRLLPAPGGTMRVLRFSGDGKRLAGMNAEGTVRQWWLEQSVVRDLAGGPARRAVLSYDGNDQGLLLGPHRGKLRWWLPSTEDAGTVSETPEGVQGVSAAKAIDGTRVAVGTDKGEVYSWSPATGEARLVARVDGAVSDLDVGRRSERDIAVGATMTGDVFLVEWDTGRSESLTRHSERVSSVRLEAGGRLVASSSWDKLVHVVDLETKSVQVLRGHRDVVSQLAFSRDGKRLLSGAWDNTSRVWSVDDELHARRKVLRGHGVGVHGARFSPDGKSVVSGGHDNLVRLWDARTGTERVLEGHTDHVFRVLYSHDGRWVASSSDDQKVRLWSTRSEYKRVFSGHRADVEELAFSHDDHWLLSGSEDSTARLWEIASGRSLELVHGRAVTNVRFSPDGKRFATASRSGQVRLYAQPRKLPKTLAPVAEFEHTDEVWAIDFGLGGNWFASADLAGALEARQLDTERVVRMGPVPRASVLRFSGDERWLAVASRQGRLWLCQPGRAECRQLHSGLSAVHALAFTPDSRLLFTAGGDGLVYAWDVETGEHRVYVGHRAPIFDLDIAPDGSRVVTASADETLRFWPVLPLPRPENLGTYLEQLTLRTPQADEPGVPTELDWETHREPGAAKVP